MTMPDIPAGWITCKRCGGFKTLRYAGSPYPCDSCDGLGMVIAPPVRLTVKMSPESAKALRDLSERKGMTIAEIVRGVATGGE